MYFVVDCKLKITPVGEEGQVAEVPAGAAPIFPAMVHQVENLGDKDGKAVFIEPCESHAGSLPLCCLTCLYTPCPRRRDLQAVR